MGMKRILCAALICSALGALPAKAVYAGIHDSAENSSPQKVVDGMATKAVRGMANITTGWLEFPKQIQLTYTEEGPTRGILVGPLKGLGMALVRTFSGVGELATFFSPYPDFYGPYFEPAFVWEKE
jgi:putative exosortase-associated protein (TIGR04073 family)